MENIAMQPQRINTTFLLRRGLISKWEEKNPILEYGEPGVGYEIEEVEDETIEPTVLSYVLKIGDGKKPWNDLDPVASDKEVQLKYENFEYEINNLINQYIVLGPPQEDGTRLPAAGIVFSPYGSQDAAGDIGEYSISDELVVDGKSSFAVGRNIKILTTMDETGKVTAKPNYCSAFGAHHKMYGYGSAAFGNASTVYSNSQYSLTAGRNLTNYGSKAVISGESSNTFESVIAKRDDIGSIKDIKSAEQMLSIFKEAGTGKETALAYGDYSANFGRDNITYGTNSVALGVQNFSGGHASNALGHANEVMGKYATGVGTNNKVNGESATAFGFHNIITNNGHDPLGSFASGMNNLVTGGYSFASGVKSQASSYGSVALGYGIKADNSNSMFVGRLNDATDDSVIFGVGNGTGDVANINLSSDGKTLEDGKGIARSNAFTVHSDGHAQIAKQGTTDNSVVQLSYVNDKINGIKQYAEEQTEAIQKSLNEDVYVESSFETNDNHIDLDIMVSASINVTTTTDLNDTNIIVNNGVIDENTLTLPAYTTFINKFEIADDPTGISEKCLYASAISSDAYYRGWTTGATTDTKIHIDGGKDYVLAFDLIGKAACYCLPEVIVSPTGWQYFTNNTSEWKTQVLHFRTADVISNANYIISFGCPSNTEYTDVYIKNIRVLDDPCLQVINNEPSTAETGTVVQELLYNPTINGFDSFTTNLSSIFLKLVDKTEGSDYASGLKGSYYQAPNLVINSIRNNIIFDYDANVDYTNKTELTTAGFVKKYTDTAIANIDTGGCNIQAAKGLTASQVARALYIGGIDYKDPQRPDYAQTETYKTINNGTITITYILNDDGTGIDSIASVITNSPTLKIEYTNNTIVCFGYASPTDTITVTMAGTEVMEEWGAPEYVEYRYTTKLSQLFATKDNTLYYISNPDDSSQFGQYLYQDSSWTCLVPPVVNNNLQTIETMEWKILKLGDTIISASTSFELGADYETSRTTNYVSYSVPLPSELYNCTKFTATYNQGSLGRGIVTYCYSDYGELYFTLYDSCGITEDATIRGFVTIVAYS